MITKITAVIPVRKGSTRCKNKNIRDFGNTNLLTSKIKTLQQIKEIDEILVSSNCNEMLKIAKDLGVNTHKRIEKYCTTECSGSDFMVNLAENVTTEWFMYTTCVTPLFTPDTFNQCLDKMKDMKEHDSVISANLTKNFIWHKNKPINYDYNNAPPSQELPDYYIPNFACCIIKTKDVIENRNVIGKNPLFIQTDPIQGIDIDEPCDFLLSELLYINDIKSNSDSAAILSRRKPLILLDCTIRDGGYLNNWNFSDEEVINCYKAISKANYDYFELGFKTNKTLLAGKGKWCYCSEENINLIANSFNGCKIAVMAKIGTFTLSDFKPKNQSNISLIRVLLAKSSMKNGMNLSVYEEESVLNARNMCVQLLELGYEVCINFACGDLITDEEIQLICKHFHDIKLKSIYLADTYGGFNELNVPKQLHKFYRELDKYGSDIRMGFHSHNNNENSLSKTKSAIYHGCTMVDSCIGGMGRGAGNLKTEILLCELFIQDKSKLSNVLSILEYYNKHIQPKSEYKYGYHPYYVIAGVLQLHPNYISELLNKNGEILNDFKLILKLDEFTKKHNCRNYDKELITRVFL